MFYAHKTPFVKTLFRCLFGAVVVCTFLCITVLMPAREVEAKVCFLPGRCVGEDPTQAATVISNIRKEQGKSCLGYNLMQIKCKGQACEEGYSARHPDRRVRRSRGEGSEECGGCGTRALLARAHLRADEGPLREDSLPDDHGRQQVHETLDILHALVARRHLVRGCLRRDAWLY